MLDFGGYGDRQRKDWTVYHRAKPTRVLSALYQAQSNAVDNEDAERFGAQRPKK
ncbi:MAG TPA: hypothetical protein VGK36_19310 [Candidatus Angelobacter sp.]|jgi:hypothetical protein